MGLTLSVFGESSSPHLPNVQPAITFISRMEQTMNLLLRLAGLALIVGGSLSLAWPSLLSVQKPLAYRAWGAGAVALGFVFLGI
jgi:hypothetical protein